jgi:hypothetical protein
MCRNSGIEAMDRLMPDELNSIPDLSIYLLDSKRRLNFCGIQAISETI